MVHVYAAGTTLQSTAQKNNTSVEFFNLHEAKPFAWGPDLSSCASSLAAVNIKVLLYWLNLQVHMLKA